MLSQRHVTDNNDDVVLMAIIMVEWTLDFLRAQMTRRGQGQEGQGMRRRKMEGMERK
jgi:hypothetical protein